MNENVVKSAARVLEVFEYFAGRKTPATVGEVCSALGYPQSSTSVLLKSLLTLGYLSYDSGTRRYAPSVKVASLGNWIDLSQSALMASEAIGFTSMPQAAAA
jgi:DNA-binding IclR family transcriptional regulator